MTNEPRVESLLRANQRVPRARGTFLFVHRGCIAPCTRGDRMCVKTHPSLAPRARGKANRPPGEIEPSTYAMFEPRPNLMVA